MIEIKELSKAFNGEVLFDKLSLVMETGTVYALVGRSGCGKSVLFHLLTSLMTRDGGLFFYNNEAVSKLPISYMQQRDLLLPWLNVLENASLPLEINGATRQVAGAQVRAHLAYFGLTDYALFYPNQLSGGMRQRVALLRALLYRQPLLLMDEPFSALDAFTALELRLFVKQLQQQTKQTILFVTHNIDEALELADEVWVMAERPVRIISTFKVNSEERFIQRDELLRRLMVK
jgi:ABC-type nitrate/sulfonate/bicarbonate transport system ATPase subunit